ncbi:efflux RND transporter periplasmic adaptor subunit [Rhizobiaceae bacterium]|nr:efflux RND transporter periplasmic adaptor subunit [Rhizobiaceae bacterium]
MIGRLIELVFVIALLIVAASAAVVSFDGAPPSMKAPAQQVLATIGLGSMFGADTAETAAPSTGTPAKPAGGKGSASTTEGRPPAAGGERARSGLASGGAAGGGGRGPRGPTGITVADVKVAPLQDRIQAIGTGRASRSVTVTAPVAGTLASIEFVSGENVEAGTVLTVLDRESEEIAVGLATAQFEAAKASADRFAALAGQGRAGVVSAAQVEGAQTALSVARAALDEAQFEFDRRAVKAPFAGRVGLQDLSLGQYVAVGASLVSLDDVSEIEVEFLVPEGKIGEIALSDPITVGTPTYLGRFFPGSIVAIDSRIDPQTRTLRVRATLPNEEGLLKVGMTFSVNVPVTGGPTAAVPALSVQWSREGAYVWRVSKGSTERVPVVIRKRDGDTVFVDGALVENELVAVEGAQKIVAGAEVAVLETGDSSAPAPPTSTSPARSPGAEGGATAAERP